MGLRFRKSVRLFPGIRLNLSKRGLSSLSLGRKGATVNLGRDGTKSTAGLPGSGLSYSSYTSYREAREGKPQALRNLLLWIAIIAALWLAGAYFG